MSGSRISARLARILRWLAPSAACACAGALAAGLAEGVAMDDPFGVAATAGFLALVIAPVLLIASVIARGLWIAWQPDELAAVMIEDGGGAPRLVGWLTVLWLAALGVAWVAFRGTWLLAAWTAFRPITIGFALPIFVVVSALVAVALSRPLASLVARGARAFDARWRRAGRPTLLTPRRVLASAAVAALATAYLAWRIVIRPRLGPLDTSLLDGPAIAIATCLVAHAAWPRAANVRRARTITGTALGVATVAAIAIALSTVRWRPALTLEIWGEQPVAGMAIERMFDLYRIRADISLAEFRPVDRPGAEHPDIVLVTIDTVRADHTPPYGGRAAMPVLEGLGARGTVFEWAFSPSNVTRRSIPSMVIGLHPHRVRGRVVGWALRVDPRHVLLAERLRAGGYETAGFMCCKGFWGEEARTGLSRGLEHVEIEQDGKALAKRARAWLEARERRPGRKPLFLWMHLLEPHNWLNGASEPRSDDERRRMYDRTLTASDAMLLDLLDAFKGRPPEHAPIAIVTADHGESLGEHGAPYHSTDLYNSQLRVPLVIAGPGIPARRVAETVSLTDLTPTIVELAGFRAPTTAIDGRSLADLATGARDATPDGGEAFAAMIRDRSNPGGVTVIIRSRWKLIDTGGKLELYDVHADPNEQHDLARTRPELVVELKTLLDARRALGSAFD